MSKSTPELNLAQLLKHPFEALVARLHDELAAAGFRDIRPAHGCVLQYAEPGGSRLTAIAQRAGLTKPTVLAAVDDLVRLGYAARLPDPADGRAKLVRLTPRGSAAAAEGGRIIAGIERDWCQRLGPRRAQALRRALEDLHETVWPAPPA
ncbi:MAG TPA: MarR family winged helix-turn-helix transcriptional regulator [Solirubrobacteraceae bacterium]|nr:MarR family winged helix-turn-helix transcriptional regulator [Solirubrobacteraceae bacterium]